MEALSLKTVSENLSEACFCVNIENENNEIIVQGMEEIFEFSSKQLSSHMHLRILYSRSSVLGVTSEVYILCDKVVYMKAVRSSSEIQKVLYWIFEI